MSSHFILHPQSAPYVRRPFHYLTIPFLGNLSSFQTINLFALFCRILVYRFKILSTHDKSFQGRCPAIRRPTRSQPLDSITLPLRCQKEHEVLFEGKSLTLVVLCTSTALRRIALCVRLLLDKEKFIGYAIRFLSAQVFDSPFRQTSAMPFYHRVVVGSCRILPDVRFCRLFHVSSRNSAPRSR